MVNAYEHWCMKRNNVNMADQFHKDACVLLKPETSL